MANEEKSSTCRCKPAPTCGCSRTASMPRRAPSRSSGRPERWSGGGVCGPASATTRCCRSIPGTSILTPEQRCAAAEHPRRLRSRRRHRRRRTGMDREEQRQLRGPRHRPVPRPRRVEPLWQDVRAGIIRNVSVGYTVRAYEVIEQDGQVPVWRAIDWQPVELSAVPIGADDGAGFRQPGSHALPSHRRGADMQHQPGGGRPTTGEPTHGSDDDRRPTPVPPRTPTPPRQTQEDTVTRESPEPPRRRRPNPPRLPRQHVQTRSDGPPLSGADHPHHPDRGADPTAATADTARRAVAEERARIAGIYDAARKLGTRVRRSPIPWSATA